MVNLKQYLRVGEAAEFLGVSPSTVRNWERHGKLRARRLPQNDYRLFLMKDLEAVLREVSMDNGSDHQSRTEQTQSRSNLHPQGGAK